MFHSQITSLRVHVRPSQTDSGDSNIIICWAQFHFIALSKMTKISDIIALIPESVHYHNPCKLIQYYLYHK